MSLPSFASPASIALRASLSLLSAVVAFLLSASTTGAEAFDYWASENYSPAIPRVDEVLGYEAGTEISRHGAVLDYFQALALAAPDQVKVVEYARSWQGRALIYVLIGSPATMARLDSVQSGMQALADPRTLDADAAEALIAQQPAVTWLSYGVHGNEISSTDAAMLTAYHLLASDSEQVQKILSESLVVIDPMQNPDGRERFIAHFETSRGLLPDSDRISAEHDEPWPGGRTNHYLFDMNRDWFIQTQPETRGRTAALLDWFPVAFVDAHEMGSDGTYFFAPEAVPYNPHLAEDQRSSLALFGLNNAKYFDRYGIDYFTREVYDAFYPGYGASWPSYYGAIAMTYEQASARGLVVRQYDGVELSYRDTVRNHFITSLATAETVAENRQKFLLDFYNYRASAIAEGRREDVRSFVIARQTDQAAANKLAGLLVRQGVEVGRSAEAFSACGRDYAAGSFVIRTDQPAKRFIRTLLDVNVPMEEEFLAEQERRRARNLPDEIYDVTGWSLPLMMNVETDSCSRVPSAELTKVGPELVQAGAVQGGQAAVSYLVPWGQAPAVRLLAQALRSGMAVKSNDKAFVHAGVEYPAGTLIIDVADNAANAEEEAELFASLESLAAATGANVVGLNDSWVTAGPSFGSANVVRHNAIKIAMAWDEPTSAYSAGNTRFVIERQFDFPVTAIRTSMLRRANLSRYQVLILPVGRGSAYKSALGEEGVARLRDWVDAGGVLISLGSATQLLADPDVDLLAIRREEAVVEVEIEKEETDGATVAGSYITSDSEYRDAIVSVTGAPDSVAGVLVRAEADQEHWLTAGIAPELHVLARGSDIYTPIRFDNGSNVVRFKGPDELVASGYLWEENKRQLAYKPAVVSQAVGAGQVIGFTQDPTVRAYLDGLNVLLMNAIFRGAAHARPVR